MIKNCNNVTFGTESSRSGSHMTTTIIQFDFYRNASSSLAPIWSLGFLLDLRTWFLLTLRTGPLIVCHRVGRASMYEPEGYSALVSICRLSTYRGMRLDHPWMSPSGEERPVSCNQTSSFVQSSGLLLVLVRVY